MWEEQTETELMWTEKSEQKEARFGHLKKRNILACFPLLNEIKIEPKIPMILMSFNCYN